MFLSDEDEDIDVLDDDDIMPSDQLSDLMDDSPDDVGSEEELDDDYDPTELENYG